MRKKILFIVIPIVLAILIVGIVGIVVVGAILSKNKSVGTTWGDTYYAYLKEAINEKDLSEAEEKFGMQLGIDSQIKYSKYSQIKFSRKLA